MIVPIAPDECLVDAVDPVGITVKPVEAQLVTDVEVDQERGGNADGKAQEVDEREELLAPEVADKKNEVILSHGWWLMASVSNSKRYTKANVLNNRKLQIG